MESWVWKKISIFDSGNNAYRNLQKGFNLQETRHSSNIYWNLIVNKSSRIVTTTKG